MASNSSLRVKRGKGGIERGKRTAEGLFVFLAKQTLYCELADGFKILGGHCFLYLLVQLFVASVQFLLAADKALHLKAVVFKSLPVHFAPEKVIGHK